MVDACNACGRTLKSHQSLLVVWAAKASCGCPNDAFFKSYRPGSGSFSAPRLVLMRCMARCEVVVDRSVVYFKSFRVFCFQVIDEETHMCPIGNVPVVFVFSSSNQVTPQQSMSLLCKKVHVRDKRILKRSGEAAGAWRILKEQKEP